MKTTSKKPTSHDYEWEDDLKIPATVGIGFKWRADDGRAMESGISGSKSKDDGHHYIRGKRVAELILSDWLGSIGAMHYYARIESGGIYGRYVADKRDGFGHCGYMGKSCPTDHLKEISIRAKRILSKLEKDMNGDPLGRIGEETERFNTPAEAKAAAVKLFQAKFEPGWILVCNDQYQEPRTGDIPRLEVAET